MKGLFERMVKRGMMEYADIRRFQMTYATVRTHLQRWAGSSCLKYMEEDYVLSQPGGLGGITEGGRLIRNADANRDGNRIIIADNDSENGVDADNHFE